MSVWSRLGAVRRSREIDRELDEELASHLEMAMEDFRRGGMNDVEARRAAMASLGGFASAREIHREARGLPVMESIWQDIRYSIRTLRRDMAMAVFAILIAGLGVGASATVFSVIQAVLLRGLPVKDPASLAWIQNNQGPGLSARTVQVGNLQDLQRGTQAFSEIGGYFAFYSAGDLQLTGQGEPERLTSVPVTGNFFPVLGVDMLMGRQFSTVEAEMNGPKAVILSHSFWERWFHADPSVVGRPLQLNNEPYSIVGILPASFDFGTIFAPGQRIDLFQAFPLAQQTDRWGNTLALVGRLKPGVSAAAAQSDTLVQAARIRQAHPERNILAPLIQPLHEQVSGGFRTTMWVLAGAVGLVMLIVCANLSNLLLSRAVAREKEIAIRSALGAGRGRLIRQMLVESLLLSGAGALFGLAFAAAAIRILASLETKVPLLSGAQLDWTAVAFLVGMSVATGIGFGLVPAWRVAGLQVSSRGATASREHARIRGALVMGGVALACLLLAGSGLLIRSFLRVMEADLGFQPKQAAALRIDPGRRFPNREQRSAYYREALQRVGGTRGVENVGLSDTLPLGTNRSWGAAAKGVVYTPENFPLAYVRVVSDGYFQAMGIPLRKGRDFRPSDTDRSANVIIVNETLARRLWPGEDPIGKVILRASAPEREVVGVVQDVRHLALEQAAGGEMYLPMWQTDDYAVVDLVVRGNGSPSNWESSVKAAMRGLDPTLPVAAFRPLQGIVDRSVSPRKFLVVLLAGFAAFALILASLGIYGVISYSVTQRRKEMGIRMALGASGEALRGAVLWQTVRLTAGGLVIGLAASWALLRTMQGLLFGVTASDPVTFGGALLLLVFVALLAGYLPARRASRLSPVEALRME